VGSSCAHCLCDLIAVTVGSSCAHCLCVLNVATVGSSCARCLLRVLCVEHWQHKHKL